MHCRESIHGFENPQRLIAFGGLTLQTLLRTVPAFYAVLALYYLWPGFRAGSPLLPVWQFLTFTQNFNLQPGTATRLRETLP